MAQPIINIKNLSKHYGNVKAVNNLNLEIEEGEIFGFLGPNGAGKTTTIRTILNFIFPTEGIVEVFGKNSTEFAPEIMKEVGYIAGEIALQDTYKVKDFLDMLEDIRGEKGNLRSSLVERFGLDESKKIKNLSKGNKQKVAIVQAFMHKPKLLILDEPTSGLDPLLQVEFYKLLHESRENGSTIFFSSHILSEIQRVCDRIGIIRKGELISVETVAELNKKNIYEVEIIFSSEKVLTKKDFEPKNIDNFHTTDHSVSFTYKGDINLLVKKLSMYNLKDLKIKEPDLESLFLTYYQS